MNMETIRARAMNLGLAGIGKLPKAQLVQKIQVSEGNNPCFGAEWRQQCLEMDCCWRQDCLKS